MSLSGERDVNCRLLVRIFKFSVLREWYGLLGLPGLSTSFFRGSSLSGIEAPFSLFLSEIGASFS